MSLKIAQRARHLRREFVSIVKLSSLEELQSGHSLTPSTKTRVRLMPLKPVLTGRKKRER